VVETFDLKIAKTMFDFVFRLYNLVSLAAEDNHTLRDPFIIVGKIQSDVAGLGLQSLTARERKTRGDDDAGTNGDGTVESDILSDVAILEALKRAGYTIPDEVEGFELLLPVRVSFP